MFWGEFHELIYSWAKLGNPFSHAKTAIRMDEECPRPQIW